MYSYIHVRVHVSKDTADTNIVRVCVRVHLYVYTLFMGICSLSSDLVWSDPEEIAGWAISPRGAGYLFGASVTQEVGFIHPLTIVRGAGYLFGVSVTQEV